MGSLFSTDGPLSRGPAASDAEDEQQLKGQLTQFKIPNISSESPTESKSSSKRDGRTYREVLCAGRETGAMSELSESSPAWKFCETPEDEEVSLQEHLP